MTSKDPLLQPYQLKHLTLKNRIISTSHEPAYSEDGLPKERYRLYHAEKAKGGMAMTMIGGSSVVDRDSPQAFGNLLIYKDEIVKWFRELADAVHAHDCRVMCQITHLGRRTGWNRADWLPVVAPSRVREPAHRAFPKEAEDFDLRRIARAYGEAARRCRDGGLDGIEIECYGHFFDGFWSPATNKRTDSYGGSLDNRLRFGLEALSEIRRQVGKDYIVGVRMAIDENWDLGFGREEGLEIARRLVATGMIDFINVIKGHIDSDESLSHVIPSMGTPVAPYLALASEVKRSFGIPVFHAARINDVATARHAIAEGHLDLVGMTRAHMAEPHIAAKIARGEEHRIRPCVGASFCIDRLYEAGEALCIHNPATGREATMPHVVRRSDGPGRKIVVVGAGPAGLEAARVSAERGHHVVLFEAASLAGGQIRLAAAISRRKEILGIVDWRVAECEHHGVAMRFNVLAEAGDVLAEKPDVVIIATGGLPNTSFLPDGEELVTTSWDILNGTTEPAEEVLLFDDNGAHPGMTAAEFIALSGSKLEFATPERIISPDVGGMNYPAYLKVFSEKNVTITLNERLRAVRRDGNKLVATLFNEYAKTTRERRVDQVVVEHGILPVEEVYFELKPASINRGEIDFESFIECRPQKLTSNPDGKFQLFRIGDAVAGRSIHAAIYDALRLCIAL
jgi:2,4-dienoyl-CoA reductase-like NADH-dependent reductase (Old Yellow Enzyme family)/threonine dehydrogenase-like Zn-dependent dehydrogenase